MTRPTSPDGIFVNKDPAKDLGLHVGDTVTVTFKNGASEQLPVDRHLQRRRARRQLGDRARDGRAGGAGRTGRLPRRDQASPTACPTSRRATAIDGAVSKFPQAKVRTAEEYKKDSAAQIDQLLVIITVLLAFAIVIAVLGISITLGLAVFERTREIGLMRAVGMTKRQTRKMVRWEAVIVSIFGAILGIVLGTLIGVALSLSVPNSVIDGITFNWSTIVIILVGAVLAGFLAALYPSSKASRMNVLEAIASE